MLQQACNRLVFICKRLATGSIEPVIGLFLSAMGLQQANYRLDRACCKPFADENKPITGSIEPVASRLQTKTSWLQAHYRLDQACCKPFADENKPVAGRLQTKTGSIEPATGLM